MHENALNGDYKKRSDMKALGRQILVEFYDCYVNLISDVNHIEASMLHATQSSGASIVSHDFHTFSPHGVSGMIIIAESHVAIHTWPEYGYAAVDIFTCGETIDPWVIQEYLKDTFQSAKVSTMEIRRGMFRVEDDQELLYKPDNTEHTTSENRDT